MIRELSVIFTAGTLILVGCKPKPTDMPAGGVKPTAVTMEDVKRDALTTIETTSAYSQQNKDKLMKDFKDRLATMDANIEKLRVKGANLANDAKVKWNARMSELDQKRQSANARLAELENSTAQAWGEVEKGAQSSWEELKSAFQNASNEFKKP